MCSAAPSAGQLGRIGASWVRVVHRGRDGEGHIIRPLPGQGTIAAFTPSSRDHRQIPAFLGDARDVYPKRCPLLPECVLHRPGQHVDRGPAVAGLADFRLQQNVLPLSGSVVKQRRSVPASCLTQRRRSRVAGPPENVHTWLVKLSRCIVVV